MLTSPLYSPFSPWRGMVSPLGIVTSAPPPPGEGGELTDEAGNLLTDEAGNTLTEE